MNKSNNQYADKGLDMQQHESGVSENEESDSITTDQSTSSTMSETGGTACKSTKSAGGASATTTQFSVQRSDTDGGLRMKISAIRPTNAAPTAAVAAVAAVNAVPVSSVASTPKEESCREGTKRKTPQTIDKRNNNRSDAEFQKHKLSNQKAQQHHQQQEEQQNDGILSEVPAKSTKIPAIPMAIEKTATTTTPTIVNAATTTTATLTAAAATTTPVIPTAALAVACAGAATRTRTAESPSSGHLLLANTSSQGIFPRAAASAAGATAMPTITPSATITPATGPSLSDATESGCSEATNVTTIATGTKKIKVKRKKAQSRSYDPKKSFYKKQSRHHHHNHHHNNNQGASAAAISAGSPFISSDSEDDAPLKQLQQQRAPRLLLTAISAKSSFVSANGMSGAGVGGGAVATLAHGSDNIGLSSSDNELPDLVNAAIKRVESDTDDTGDTGGFRKDRIKNLPQYQSTLLQDFMEKTQMLGQTETTTTTTSTTTASMRKAASHPAAEHIPTALTCATKTFLRAEMLLNLNSNSPSESNCSSSGHSKKRRGRPKKSLSHVAATVANANATANATANANTNVNTNVESKCGFSAHINESADSGVISTTTQSTTPSPKMSCATATTTTTSTTIAGSSLSVISPQRHKQRKPEVTGGSSSATYSPGKSAEDASKPKIDIAYLDKRMYAATERVLYPPPRNKRRQSTASSVVAAQKPCTIVPQQERKVNTKDELQIDPVWRKIDVNKKFRRPSLSGYKSDGGGGNTTVCSKILAAKSGYVSDYGSAIHTRTSHHHQHHHSSGYKSDASGKSRCSTKSCASRRSRAKSCGYRSDCKDSGAILKSTKFRRKRRGTSLIKAPYSKSVGNLNDEQDILQLADLSLGQSSEDSNEYVCKPNLANLPTTSVSKKYGEINRFIATGEYFGRGSSSFAGLNAKHIYETTTNDDASQDGFAFNGKVLLQRKNSLASEMTQELLLPHNSGARKIKSRRSSVASYCSSYYSGTSKVKRKRRRRSFRFPASGKAGAVDSKLLTEIEIITSTFGALCRIQSAGSGSIGDKDKSNSNSSSSSVSQKEKQLLLSDAVGKLAAASCTTGGGGGGSGSGGGGSGSVGKREGRDKRTLKKRKMSENLDFASLSANGGALTPSSGSTKRRHKKTSNSSPDDHKLPLKKRHYLLTPGEKSTEAAAAAAVAAKLFASNAEVWVAAAAVAKSSASTKSQYQFSGKSAKTGLTPKKRHLLQTAAQLEESGGGNIKSSNSSPLRIVVDTNSISGGKLLDISPISLSCLKQNSESANHKKRTRVEGGSAGHKPANSANSANSGSSADDPPMTKSAAKHNAKATMSMPQMDAESSCPPPGVFEPSVELEIQIPPIAKLTEATAIITKSEVDSPLFLELNKNFSATATKTESARVVETLLNKTGGNLILKRKRKKFNRTGFPTVRRKKRKINEHLLLDVTPDISEQVEKVTAASMVKLPAKTKVAGAAATQVCDRVPQTGETSETFLERANRTPRLSVVALERLLGTPPSNAVLPPVAAPPMPKGKRQASKKPHADDTADSSTSAPKPNRRLNLLRTEAAVDDGATPTSNRRMRGRKSKIHDIVSAESKQKRELTVSPSASASASASASPSVGRLRMPSSSPSASSLEPPAKLSRKSAVVKTQKSSFNKSTMQKIITAKTLESQVKLPDGIDPNTNFSCKIRLKRGSSIHPVAVARELSPAREAPPQTSEEIAVEAAAKDAQAEQLEHDVLPLGLDGNVLDSEASYDTSDEKSSSASTATTGRRAARLRKIFLPAGLFSNYFKGDNQKSSPLGKKGDKKDASAEKVSAGAANDAAAQPTGALLPLLPPPPYCEKYFRRTQVDFQLPYDIWWAYKNAKLPTRITVPSWNYRKIRTNVYAESVRPNTAGIDHPTCNCKPDVGCGENCLNRMVYTECSPSTCPTRDKCHNQKIQRHEVAPGAERFMTENKGWGVRTKLPIKKGTYILEYVGEVVTEREFKDRMGTLYLNDTHHYCLHLDGGLVIDGHRMGSDGRFVNHSCEPNCEMQKWSVNGLSRMALFAKRNIADGEELTYDYNFSLFNPSEGQPCRCNTPQCRGVIGGKSQRVKPLPMEAKANEPFPKDVRNGARQRKRKARKNAQRLQAKDVVVAQRVQQLSEKEKKLIRQHSVFLLRNFEKVCRCRDKKSSSAGALKPSVGSTSAPTSPQNQHNTSNGCTPAAITIRRPSTPSSSSLAAQIFALCSPRNMKTRGLTLAVQDPEVERMAKMAVVLRDICTALETVKDANDESIVAIALSVPAAGHKKKKAVKSALAQKQDANDLKTIQVNIEQGYYKQPSEFDEDMQKMFADVKQAMCEDDAKRKALDALIAAYELKKHEIYPQLLELVGEESVLDTFRPATKQLDATHPFMAVTDAATDKANKAGGDLQPREPDADALDAACTKLPPPPEAVANTSETVSTSASTNTAIAVANDQHKLVENKIVGGAGRAAPAVTATADSGLGALASSNEDIIRCICGLYKDEGLMIQCARCMVWQHTECTKADVDAENYLCETCEPRTVDREIPLEEFTDEGHRYFLTLMRGTLHVRQGDAVYVLRDIPIKDADGNIVPSKKHTYETIGDIDYNECDIFRVERLWKNDEGKRFIFGHHFLRPHETFHEPSRRFYPNEVVRVPLYEVVPIELVIGRCWVLDRTTFCKGRPIECTDEEHCFICELRVDKSARFFSKAKVNYPTCTKSYAFHKFSEKLKISKTYAPHDVDPSMLKSKKPKVDIEPAASSLAPLNLNSGIVKPDLNRAAQNSRKRQSSSSPAALDSAATLPATLQTVKGKRTHLENVLKGLKWKNTHLANDSPIDLSYLLSGRGARQRKY